MARVRVQTPSSTFGAKSTTPNLNDSPSRQLMLDLERALSQAQIHEAELHRVHSYGQRLFHENLDRVDRKKAREDVTALNAATTRHENVRKEAEAELQRYYRQAEEQERRKREKEKEEEEEEERRAREQQARAKAEAERKARERAEREAKRQREQAAARKTAEEKARAEQAQRRERDDAIAREKAEQERKRTEEQERAKAVQQAADEKAAEQRAAEENAAREVAGTRAAQSHGHSPPALGAAEEELHQRYLQIHQHLKKFRKEFWAQCKKDANLKTKVGDMRRAVRTSVGQLTEAKGANKLPTERIKLTLAAALAIPSPPVDARDIIAVPPVELQSPEQSQCPSLLIYVLNTFSKAIISQFGGESGISIRAAEPAGVLVAQIFAANEYRVKGHSLIDILLAKLHFTCPVLWGVYGNEKTREGRGRLGWRMEDGAFVSETRHHERVSGLGAGFASIALRNFTKSRLQNPFPPTNFWGCLANIVNVPPNDVQPTHLFVLKAMLENSAERFVQFYGSAAIAALRHALVDFPASLPPGLQNTAGTKAIILLVEMLEREKNVRL